MGNLVGEVWELHLEIQGNLPQNGALRKEGDPLQRYPIISESSHAEEQKQKHHIKIPPAGWDKLFVSLTSVDSGKVTAKTSKAHVRNGTCKWGDPIYETTRLLQDTKTQHLDEKLYKLIVAMGTSRSSLLGEANINLADYEDASTPASVALPLHGSNPGSMLHGDPIFWVSTHRYHHQVTDTERDPHSPVTEGLLFAHMGWLFDYNKMVRKGVNYNNVRDLENQPYYRFLQKTMVLHAYPLVVLLYLLGGFPYVVWGMSATILVAFIGGTQFVLQQFAGINRVLYFSSLTFQDVGISSSALASLSIGLTNIAGALVALNLIDKQGRRQLLIGSYLGMAASMFLVVYAITCPLDEHISHNLSVLGTLMYIFTFAIGAGPVTGLIIPELSSSRTGSKIMGFSFSVHWVCKFLVGLFFLELVERLGVAPVYSTFGGVSLLSAVFVNFFIDETKDRSLEEIEMSRNAQK